MQESTIGAAFLTKTLTEHNVKFEIWCAASDSRPCAAAFPCMQTCLEDSDAAERSFAGTQRARNDITALPPCTTGEAVTQLHSYWH